jgi:hypothetical protein
MSAHSPAIAIVTNPTRPSINGKDTRVIERMALRASCHSRMPLSFVVDALQDWQFEC